MTKEYRPSRQEAVTELSSLVLNFIDMSETKEIQDSMKEGP
jgi:hypothetical protein